uniref:Uncharacterized protein n=1 Tax=Magallana gigas TaxID=29159 RepID=K1QEV8_MAGGI
MYTLFFFFFSGLADVEVKGIEESILFPSALLQELFPTSVVTTRLPLTGIKVGNKLVKILFGDQSSWYYSSITHQLQSLLPENKARGYWGKPKTDEYVRAIALRRIRQQHGVTSNEVDVLGHHELQFGTYRGQTFSWIPENCLGYAGWLVMKMEAESSKEQPKDNKEQTINKQKFRKYMMHFPEGRKAVKMKKETHSSMKQAPSPQTSSVGKSSELKSLVLSSHLTPHALQHMAKILLSPKEVQPSIPTDMTDNAHLHHVLEMEKLLYSMYPFPADFDIRHHYITSSARRRQQYTAYSIHHSTATHNIFNTSNSINIKNSDDRGRHGYYQARHIDNDPPGQIQRHNP